jgi:hypothetical protein
MKYLRSLIALILAVSLIACNPVVNQPVGNLANIGGGIGGTGMTCDPYGGIGGTGKNIGGGIGGTGMTCNNQVIGGIGGTGIIGTITGFGSIIVNGIHIEYTNDQEVESILGSTTGSDLQIGQVVAVSASVQGDEIVADRIVMQTALAGEVQHIDVEAGEVTIANRTVTISDQWADRIDLQSLQVGDTVVVSGQRDAGGLFASRIDVNANVEASQSGYVTEVGQDYVILDNAEKVHVTEQQNSTLKVGAYINTNIVVDSNKQSDAADKPQNNKIEVVVDSFFEDDKKVAKVIRETLRDSRKDAKESDDEEHDDDIEVQVFESEDEQENYYREQHKKEREKHEFKAKSEDDDEQEDDEQEEELEGKEKDDDESDEDDNKNHSSVALPSVSNSSAHVLAFKTGQVIGSDGQAYDGASPEQLVRLNELAEQSDKSVGVYGKSLYVVVNGTTTFVPLRKLADLPNNERIAYITGKVSEQMFANTGLDNSEIEVNEDEFSVTELEQKDSDLEKELEEKSEALEEELEGQNEAIEKELEEQKEAIGEALEEEQEAIEVALEEQQEAIEEALEEQQEAIEEALEEQKEAIEEALEEQQEAIEEALEEQQEAIEEALEEQQEAIEEALEEQQEAIKGNSGHRRNDRAQKDDD